ncbi:hypothetical protein DL237_14285 [Pseudooceanicola sediminis]|uniref:Uncharacterized protein n=1 Tax=Pseudooceanicola sediminis TaxID=2211117 RepID=A0A399IY37_9RHOB|nr:hypothetical protein DL237_14285 [Pseudooceanicola sediminis]
MIVAAGVGGATLAPAGACAQGVPSNVSSNVSGPQVPATPQSTASATGTEAETVTASSSERLRDTAQLVVSERLRTYALARGLARGEGAIGTARDLKALLAAQGYYMEGAGFTLLEAEQGVYPALAYVPNMNGGSENDQLVIQGYVFRLREDLVARGGAAFGLSYDGRVRLGWAQGHYLEARAELGVLYAPEPDLTRTVGQISLCARNQLVNWNFLDLCYSHIEVRRDLADQAQDDVELAFSHLFEVGRNRHEVGFALGHSTYGDLDQTHATISLDSVGGRVATRLSLDLAEPLIYGATGTDLALRAEVRWLAAGHVVGLGLQASQSARSTFFGERRQDQGLGVTALYQIKDNLVLSVGVSQVKSSVDFFDQHAIQFNISTKLR